MRQSLIMRIGLLACVILPTAALGHAPYGKALKARYDLRSVSCYACHAKGKDKKTGKPLGKEHLNSFGQVQAQLLKDQKQKVKEQLEAAKKLSRVEREKVNQAVAADFLKTMKKIENKPAASEKTWLELLKSGALEGIRLKK